MIKLAIFLLSVTFAVDALAAGTLIAVGVIGLTAGTITAIAVAAAINIAIAYVVSTILTPKNRISGTAARDEGVRVQVPPDTTRSIPLVYGGAYIGGKFVDAVMTTNASNMYYVMAISSISDDGQFTFDKSKFYYGDRQVVFSTTNQTQVVGLIDGAGNTDTKISGFMSIYLFRSNSSGVITNLDIGGTAPGSATPQNIMSLANGLPSGQEWPATGRQMNGLAFAIIHLVYNRDAGTTQLQPLTFYAQHNLRGLGHAAAGDVWYDYMTNPVYGAAVDPQYVDYASAVALNVYSDQLVTFRNQAGTLLTQSRYRINGVLDTNQNILQNVDQIMTACDCWMSYQETTGKWEVIINKAEAASYAFDDSNIIGAMTVGGIDITNSINQIEAKFPDGNNRDQYSYVYVETPVGLLYPNEPVNKTDLNYDLVNNSVQAYYLANRLLEQAREDLNLTINTTYDGIQVNAGDVVSVTNAYYGWNAKLFRAMQVREASTEDGNLGAQIQLAEYNAQVYDDFDITQFAPSPNSGLVAGGFFSDLASPTVVSPLPQAVVPTFGVQVFIPVTGRVSSVYLYYTTSTAPTATDWALLDFQTPITSAAFVNNTYYEFTDLSLPTGVYYFSYKVGNEITQSNFSPVSSGYSWGPINVDGTFVATFSPSAILVPFDGTTATFTNAIASLNGATTLGQTQFVASQTDTDSAFINNTYRIGSSSTTGYGSIVKTNITIGNPSVSGIAALFPIPTAMSANSATLTVPVRYKDNSGVITQGSATAVQFNFVEQGVAGVKSAQAYLYQWSTSTPATPSGTSIYTWATGTNALYSGGGGWTTTIPANPGTPNIYLWEANKQLTAPGTDATSTVNWTSGVGIAAVSLNGAAGLQSATPTVFQWAITIPSAPTGTSTYTWSSGTFTPTPSGWSLTPPASPSPGFTLWGATVSLLDSATQTTSSINWTTASVSARGYAGEDGATGATGTTGSSARVCYTKTTLGSLASTPATVTTTGSTSFPANNEWGTGTVWGATPPTLVAGESLYQSDGVYSFSTDQTVWNVPYLSSLKVGSLSAITANLGSVTAGNISIGNTSQGLFVNNPSYANAVYVFQNSQTTYGLNVSNAWAANNGGGAAIFTSNYGYTAQFGLNVNAASPNPSDLNCAGLFAGAGGGIAALGVSGANGGYAGYAASGTWSPFTGSHDGLIALNTDIESGDIVIDTEIVVTKLSDSLTIVEKSITPNQVGALGVFVSQRPLLHGVPAALMTGGVIDNPAYVNTLAQTYNNTVINSVGEGAVNVCGEGGNIQIGDLIVTSSMAGKGMKQADDIVRSSTVARAREAATFTSSTNSKLVACIYVCG